MNLRIIRQEKDLTQKQIGDVVGISEAHYSLIESGKRRPSVEVAKRIAAVLGFDWTRFYDDGDAAAVQPSAAGPGA